MVTLIVIEERTCELDQETFFFFYSLGMQCLILIVQMLLIYSGESRVSMWLFSIS